MATHHSAEQWRTWLADFECSGLTVATFCESIGVSAKTFYKWRRKLGGQGRELVTRPEFVPVVLQKTKLEIELPGGAVARVDNDADAIRPLVEVLLELGTQR